MAVKLPVLLDSTLHESAILYPTKGSLRLEASGVSEAQLTLGDKSQTIPMHGWVKLYNKNGMVGIFRRTSRNNNITIDKNVTLRHGIDILQDSVWEGSEDFEGTRAQFLTAILNHQTSLIGGVKPWTLGTCEDVRTVKKSLNYDKLLDLLLNEAEDGGDYYYVYDQSVWPWTVSLLAKPSGVRSEFRLNRNIEKCRISDNDSELCTRLILNVNKKKTNSDPDTPDEEQSIYRVYNNAAAQAAFGIITKTADIDVTQDTLPGGPFPEADAWAADFLAKRSAPQLQIQVDALILSGLTGGTWDESRLGELCRVALPDYSESITQRVVTVTYPDLFGMPSRGAPERISISLANTLPSYSQSLKAVTRETEALAKANRQANRDGDSLNKYFSIVDRQGNILRQAGMKLDAYGMLVYADDNVNMIGSRFEVQADRIGMVVGSGASGNYIKAGEIALAINNTTGESTALINADHVNISGTQTAHLLVNALEQDDSGHLVITTSGGARIRKTEGGVTAEYGIYDEDSLTAGVMVNKINGQTAVKISGNSVDINGSNITINADRIDVSGLLATQQFQTAFAHIDEIAGDLTVYGNLTNPGNFSAGNVTTDGDVGADGNVEAGSFLVAGLGVTVGTGGTATWQSQQVVTSVSVAHNTVVVKLASGADFSLTYVTSAIPSTTTINFLGAAAAQQAGS